MRALTVQQPWAWAIIHGGKDIENRTQAWTYRGPLAIHAGSRWSERGGLSPLVAAPAREAGLVYTREVGCDYMLPGIEWTTGAIIGVVDLVDVHHYAGSGPDAIDCCESPWAEESYAEHGGKRRLDIVHLVLEHPRPLEVPIPCRGALGLWTPPAEVLEQLQAAIA